MAPIPCFSSTQPPVRGSIRWMHQPGISCDRFSMHVCTLCSRYCSLVMHESVDGPGRWGWGVRATPKDLGKKVWAELDEHGRCCVHDLSNVALAL